MLDASHMAAEANHTAEAEDAATQLLPGFDPGNEILSVETMPDQDRLCTGRYGYLLRDVLSAWEWITVQTESNQKNPLSRGKSKPGCHQST